MKLPVEKQLDEVWVCEHVLARRVHAKGICESIMHNMHSNHILGTNMLKEHGGKLLCVHQQINSLRALNLNRHHLYSQKQMSHAHNMLQRGAWGWNATLAWICKSGEICTEQDRNMPITTH